MFRVWLAGCTASRAPRTSLGRARARARTRELSWAVMSDCTLREAAEERGGMTLEEKVAVDGHCTKKQVCPGRHRNEGEACPARCAGSLPSGGTGAVGNIQTLQSAGADCPTSIDAGAGTGTEASVSTSSMDGVAGFASTEDPPSGPCARATAGQTRMETTMDTKTLTIGLPSALRAPGSRGSQTVR